ncbi:MAG TPA: GNAT family N-acetyltransferase [Ramlibacter sp.]|nr:GNAT family N-acetyltransferase [Ramlibacter sp.]
MKSDPLPATFAESGDQYRIPALLIERTRGLQPGDKVSLSDLRDLDPYGAEAFATLARRYGVSETSPGTWVLERKPRWLPAWIGSEHEAQWFELFEAAYGYRIDARLWRWKYRGAVRPGMGAWRDGRLVAFYGAMPRATLFLGKPVSTVQIGDVMVRPEERGVMTRSGPFQIAASTFIDRSVGYGRPHLFGFGFPTDKALQVAQKLGLYERVDQMTELAWPAADSWGARLLRSEQLMPQHRPVIESLWQAMAQDFRGSVIGVRDADYIEQRYQMHPTVHYECLLVRKLLTGAAQGLVVLRSIDQDQVELMDLIGPRSNFAALVEVARRWAWRNGARRVRAWVTASHVELLAGTAPAATPMDLMVPANVWSPGPSADELRGRWWLMAGDTDFR